MSQCWEWGACGQLCWVLIRSHVLPRSSSPFLLPTPNESRQALLLSLEKMTSWDPYACQEAGRLWELANLLTKCSRGSGTNPREEELSCSCDDLFLSSGQQPCAQPLFRWWWDGIFLLFLWSLCRLFFPTSRTRPQLCLWGGQWGAGGSSEDTAGCCSNHRAATYRRYWWHYKYKTSHSLSRVMCV